MTPESVETLLQLPMIGILIFLLYRESAAKEKLLQMLIEQARQHTLDMVSVLKDCVPVPIDKDN